MNRHSQTDGDVLNSHLTYFSGHRRRNTACSWRTTDRILGSNIETMHIALILAKLFINKLISWDCGFFNVWIENVVCSIVCNGRWLTPKYPRMNALGTICVLSALALAAHGVCKTGSLSEVEQIILDKHNELRRLHQDTPDLCYGESGDDITFASREWADDMAAKMQMAHSTR